MTTTDGFSSDEDEKWMESLPQGPLFATNSSLSKKNEKADDATTKAPKSIECIEQEARKRVDSLIGLQRSDYQRYRLCDFYWHSHKGHWYPCHRVYNICTIGPQPSRYQVPIQYIGKNWRIDKRIYFARQRDLQPALEGTTTTSETPRWCPERVAAYRDIVLGVEKWAADEEKSQGVAFEEVFYLDAIRDVVVERLLDEEDDEDEDDKNTALPAPVTMESENSDDDEEEEPMVAEEETELQPVAEGDKNNVASAKQDKPVVSRRNPRDRTKKTIIRAGDVIQYVPPHQIFCGDNMVYSAIKMVRVVGDGKGIALMLFDGSMLPRDCRVQVLARYLRGKLRAIEEKDRFWVELTECRLKRSDLEKDPLGMESIQDKFERLCDEVQDFADNYDPREAEKIIGDQGDESSVDSSTDSKHTKPRSTSLPMELVEQQNKSPKYRSRHSIAQPARKPSASKLIPKSVIKDLEKKIEQCEKDRTKRRSDKAAIAVRETSLKIAIQVVHRAFTIEDLEDMASDWDVTRATLENFINGNPKNLLRLEVVEDLSKKFAGLLAKGSEPTFPNSPSAKAATASQEPNGARDPACETNAPIHGVPTVLETSQGVVSNESNPSSMLVAAPPIDTHDSAEISAPTKASDVFATNSENPPATASVETNEAHSTTCETNSPSLGVPMEVETSQAVISIEANSSSEVSMVVEPREDTPDNAGEHGSFPTATESSTPTKAEESLCAEPHQVELTSISTSSENLVPTKASEEPTTPLEKLPNVATSLKTTESPAPTPATENSAPALLNMQRDTKVQNLKSPSMSSWEATMGNNAAPSDRTNDTTIDDETENCLPSRSQSVTDSKRTLNEKIRQCDEKSKKIKLDLEYIVAQKRALQVAVRAGEHKISENQIAGFAKAWGVTITALQRFLRGSTEHELSTDELVDISAKFESVLAE